MKRRQRPEQVVQRAVVEHLRTRGVARLCWWHTPNGGWRSPIEGAILKGLGTRAGVADLIIVHNGRCFALELKATNGKPTEAQTQFISDLTAAGGFGCIAEGIDQAIATLERWGLLRGSACA